MTPLRQPVCRDCPHYLDCTECTQQVPPAQAGERFCTWGKKARRFGRRDPKWKVPVWCPRRKQPCVLRVYAFRSNANELMDAMLRRDLGSGFSPSAHRYALAQELHINLTPVEFWKRIQTERTRAGTLGC